MKVDSPLRSMIELIAPIGDERPAGAEVVGYARFKPIAETTIALALLALTGPLIGLLVGLTRIVSPGPGFYRQVRLGRGGRPFIIFKIRTMAHDCERATGPQWSTPGDPRVTRLGALLRRTHLDELPQLWNVVRGEMSLVGPRPERPVFVRQLKRTLPRYPERMAVLPGITGLAQVQRPADEDLPGVRRKLEYDLCYIERIGPWLDARIVVATVLKVLGVPFGVTGRLLALPQPDALDESPVPSSWADDLSGTCS